MGKYPGKLSSYEVIDYDKQELASGKQDVTGACWKVILHSSFPGIVTGFSCPFIWSESFKPFQIFVSVHLKFIIIAL